MLFKKKLNLSIISKAQVLYYLKCAYFSLKSVHNCYATLRCSTGYFDLNCYNEYAINLFMVIFHVKLWLCIYTH